MKRLHAVADIDARSPDAGAILDDDEMGLRWVEVEIGVEELSPMTENEIRCCRNDKEHADRIAVIESWARECGGIVPALVRLPLLLHRDKSGGPDIVDGWHRLCVARRAGVFVVRALYVNKTLSDEI